jgi:enoyl-CoA hydratase/carnithine racemase
MFSALSPIVAVRHASTLSGVLQGSNREVITMSDGNANKTLVKVEKDGGVAVFTLDDPPANTYTHEMMKQLDAAIVDARFDNDVSVIVIRGAGDKFFCAGANIDMLQKSDPTWKYFFCLHANETLSRLEHTPKLVIAALNGHTVGGGLEVAMAADLRIARKGAGKVGLPEVTLGVLPGTGGTQRLTRLVGKSKAIELMAEGGNFEMVDAAALGIVNKVFEADSTQAFMDQVMEYARQFTTPGKASMAVGHIKRACQSGAEVPLEQGLAIERELQAKLFSSQDAKEGLTAFVEKRKPQFAGK